MKKVLKYISFAFGVSFIFSSCLKDDVLIGPDAPGAIQNVVEFKNIANISSPAVAPYPVFVPQTLDPENPEVTIEAVVRYAGVNNAPSDITVELIVDNSAVVAYNAAQTSVYETLGSDSYEFPSSVTIKKGEREAIVPIKLHVSKFNQTKENVLPLKIKSLSTNDVISGNFGTVIYSFPVKSIWEGTYDYSIINNFGTIDGNIGGSFSDSGIKLSTVGPNKLYVQYFLQTYSGYVHYQFNAENTSITSIYAFSGSALATSINEVILVDPVNRIFEIRWTGLGRGVIERFVRTGD